jgi:WD40 repeat protein
MVQLRDVADPAHPRMRGQPLVGSASVVTVAFSPGGQTLASGSADGTVRLWDVADPAHPRSLGQPLVGSSGTAVYSVAFGSGGRTLASGYADGAVRLWNLNVQYAVQRICATAGGLTSQQWDQYIPDLPYQPSCVH